MRRSTSLLRAPLSLPVTARFGVGADTGLCPSPPSKAVIKGLVTLLRHFPLEPESIIPCPPGVPANYHKKYATLFMLLMGDLRFTRVPPNQVSVPSYVERYKRADAGLVLNLKYPYVLQNFGADWEEGVVEWFQDVYSKIYPAEDVAQVENIFYRQCARLKLTSYTFRELSLALHTNGISEDLEEQMMDMSLRESVRCYRQLGAEKYEEKIEIESSFLGWTEEQKNLHLEAVKMNA